MLHLRILTDPQFLAAFSPGSLSLISLYLRLFGWLLYCMKVHSVKTWFYGSLKQINYLIDNWVCVLDHLLGFIVRAFQVVGTAWSLSPVVVPKEAVSLNAIFGDVICKRGCVRNIICVQLFLLMCLAKHLQPGSWEHMVRLLPF